MENAEKMEATENAEKTEAAENAEKTEAAEKKATVTVKGCELYHGSGKTAAGGKYVCTESEAERLVNLGFAEIDGGGGPEDGGGRKNGGGKKGR